LHSIRTVFLPNFAEPCALDEFAEKMAMFLMDNWSSQIPSDIIRLLTEERVRVIPSAPHKTSMFQIFDLIFFHVLKRHPRYELAFGGEKVTVKFLMKARRVKQITIDSGTWGTFQSRVLESKCKLSRPTVEEFRPGSFVDSAKFDGVQLDQ
jgi:hypothetical protein